MPFTIFVAADLYGKKYNTKFTFPLCPGMSELVNGIESVYDVCARANRPTGYADVPFKTQALQIFDSVVGRWIDIYGTGQVTDGLQLFAFQPDSIWHTDSKGMIPPPRETITWVSGKKKARAKGLDTGAPPSLTEKLRTVFHKLDFGSKGYCQYTDVREGLANSDIEFTCWSSSELFREADSNSDGRLSYDEWVSWSLVNSSIIDALYFRLKDAKNEKITWLSSIVTDSYSPTANREQQLQQVHDDVAWARERVSTIHEFEQTRQEADIARLRHQTALNSQSTASPPFDYYLTSVKSSPLRL